MTISASRNAGTAGLARKARAGVGVERWVPVGHGPGTMPSSGPSCCAEPPVAMPRLQKGSRISAGGNGISR